MFWSREEKSNWIEYLGNPLTQPCVRALARLLEAGERFKVAIVVTSPAMDEHALALIDAGDDENKIHYVVQSGFGSGYPGEGPDGLATAIAMVEAFGAWVKEVPVTRGIWRRLEASGLTESDSRWITEATPRVATKWVNYRHRGSDGAIDDDVVIKQFPPIIPLGVLESEMLDLALSFRDDPDRALIKGFVRLEERLRDLTGTKKDGKDLIRAALRGSGSALVWSDIDASEADSRAELFCGLYGAHRNPLTHREVDRDGGLAESTSEFMALNHLFKLLKQAVRRGDE